MRRGHPGVGGWRNENHRHFRPRTGGAPRFRPPRAYSLCDIPRFPPPGPRLPRGPHIYNAHLNDHGISENHDGQNYRPPNHHHNNPRLQDRHQPRPRNVYSYTNPNYKKDDIIQNHSYKHSTNFYKDAQGELVHVNSHGDVDHRQLGNTTHDQDAFNPSRINSWIDPPPNQRYLYEDRNQTYRPHDSDRQHTEGNKIPLFDYTGHRPPSSDYYGSTSGTTINNNDTSFSRSVNDTVDIVRKRLMNRSDPQATLQDASNSQNNSEQELERNTDQHTLQELPTKKRTPRQRQNVKSNCDKMKSNIVNQLFKMDKDKMHKLMDDPGSSSKFEYAISSLITESQNSLNRHLRSVAEKSLVSTCSDDFIHNDNNTIYEDTFMKQMQCLLDPQDTILLEDIKPLVMAELSKVLQLDDFEPYTRYDTEDQGSHAMREVPQNYPNYDDFNYDDFPQEVNYDIDLRNSSNYGDVTQAEVYDVTDPHFNNETASNQDDYQNSNLLFERRTTRHDPNHESRRLSAENHRQRKSIDNAMDEIYSPTDPAPPLFNSNAENLSEEEDTFAELDRQYHVAVDPNFLDDVSARTTPNYMLQVEVNPASVKKEVNHQLLSSESVFESVDNKVQNNSEINVQSIKEEILQSPDFPKENNTPINSDSISSRTDHVNMNQEHAARCNDTSRESEKSKSSNISKISASNSRKRSIDQRPSHRKEKRKKSESHSSDNHDNSSSKNRHSKSNDLPKSSYYSIFSSKDDYGKQCSKDKRRNNNSQKGYSEKYVKRKQSQKSKDREPHKNRTSSLSSQTILSPKDSNNTSISSAKSDSKTKLKPIDMFVEQTKKVSVHHAHRNTATNPTTPTTAIAASKTPVFEEKVKQVICSPQKIVQTKHVSTQVIKRVITKMTQTVDNVTLNSRHCQTENPKLISVGVQTSRVISKKAETETKDAFERMKQIDLEIQELLQEKFKLYSNLESSNMGPHEESYLSVTVLNVGDMEQQGQHLEIIDQIDTSPVDNTLPIPECKEESDIKVDNESNIESNMAADAIVDDFTNIPVEELEQIALETVTEDINFDDTKVEKRSARHKALLEERMASESPKSTSSKRSSKKSKTPNISLLEQIITDDRPLEEIISLDDLEEPRQRKRKKPPKSKPKKTTAKKSKSKKQIDISNYDLKECSVILIQTDISKYLHESSKIAHVEDLSTEIDLSTEKDNVVTLEPSKEYPLLDKEWIERPKSSVSKEVEVEETVGNDLQFDMLDVSEDIVIGDSYEIKDKDSIEPTVPISEDLILDNSQSSADDVLMGDSGHAVCKTYDYSTDEDLRRDSLTVMGNADAVLAIECIENDFVAACLDGNVYHFSGDGQLLNTMRGSNLAVTCLTIVKEKYGTTVYTGSLDSRIRYYDLNTGLEKGPECNVLSPIQTMDRAWDTVFVGTRTGFVLQFECKNNMLIPVSTVKFSEQAILALRAMKEGPRKVLLVASRSENVTIKDAQTGLLLRTLVGPKMTVYTLLFEDGKVYCGTSSHQIHVFDYSSGTHTGCHEGGKGAVCLRATGGLLFAGCYDGCVYVYREGETRPLAQLRGPSLMLLSLAIVGSKIIAGYKDRSLYIWKIPLSILQEMIL